MNFKPALCGLLCLAVLSLCFIAGCDSGAGPPPPVPKKIADPLHSAASGGAMPIPGPKGKGAKKPTPTKPTPTKPAP
jgi:hypothetical protein